MKVQDSISINADRARVFEVFCDLENAAANIGAITKLEVLAGPAQLNLGTRWRETRTMFGQQATEEMWVTGYEQDASYWPRRSPVAPTIAASTASPRTATAPAST
jgi:hypothetical protein